MLGNFSSPNRTRVIEMLTDGSPNRPDGETTAVPLAYDAAWQLKDKGIIILTLGMGTACTPSKPTDCLNREVLDTMASEPTSNFALLLNSYESLAAMSLFISAQCKPVVAGFEPSPLPPPSPQPGQLAQPSPNPAHSPPPAQSPQPKCTTSQQCVAQEDLVPDTYVMYEMGACNQAAMAQLLQEYDCVELQPSCGSFQCSKHVPPEVAQQLRDSLNS